MRLLGHRDIKNTLIYIDVEHAIFQTSENDEFTVKVADNVEGACKLAEAGFEKFDEFDGLHLYRKRK